MRVVGKLKGMTTVEPINIDKAKALIAEIKMDLIHYASNIDCLDKVTVIFEDMGI